MQKGSLSTTTNKQQKERQQQRRGSDDEGFFCAVPSVSHADTTIVYGSYVELGASGPVESVTDRWRHGTNQRTVENEV